MNGCGLFAVQGRVRVKIGIPNASENRRRLESGSDRARGSRARFADAFHQV